MQQRLRLSAHIVTGILLAWILFLPVNVHALGFGNINMKSALNEPLDAEIELLSATPEDIKNLEVKLASREAFLRAGVDRSALLSRIKFDIVKRSGKYYVTLTTQESVREPFLNFLLEMNWKSGRMLREYTMLLDPPDRVQRQQMARAPELTPAEVEPAAPAPMPAPEPVIAAAEQPLAPEPAPQKVESPFLDAPAPAPVAAAEEPLYPAIPLDQPQQVPAPAAAPEPVPAPEPVAIAPEPVTLEPAPAPVEVPPAEAMAAKEPTFEPEDGGLFPQIPLRAYKESDLSVASAPAPAPEPAMEGMSQPYEPVGELDYGITRKGDTAWKVAEKLRPSEEISVYQIMMALQQSNPSAFVNGNIHRLKEGQVLRIDDPSLLTAMSKQQAAEQYQTQTQVWEEYLTSVGAAVPRQAIVAGEQPFAEEAGGPPSGELTLASPRAEDVTAGTGSEQVASGADSDVLRAQVRQAMREAETERSRNAQLTAKLNELEAELRRLENLVNIKDSDLASLQRKLEEMNAQRAAGGAEMAMAEPTPAPREEPAPVPTPEPMAQMPEPIQAPEPAPEPSATEQDIAAATQPEPAEIETAPAAGAEITPPEPVVEPVAPVAPMPAPAAKTDGGGIMGTVSGILGAITGMFAGMGSMTMMIIIGVVAIVVILLVFIMIRRKRGIHFQESILNTGASDVSPNSVQMDMTPSQGASLMGGESSFLSDFAISGVSAIQAEDSEVDPLTEADVFMAYGRYEAAEERLQEAINQDPARGELRVKLLELYNTTKNKNSFESAAEDFYAALGDSASGNPLWQKVVAMGKQIAPGNPLFRGKAAAGYEAAPQMDTANLNQNDVMDIGLDTGVFSNSEFNPIENTGNTAAAEAFTSGGDLDFNLDMATNTQNTSADDDLDFSLDMDMASSKAPKAGADTGLDFSLDMDTHTEDTRTAKNASDNSMEFNLDMSSGDEPTATDIKLDMGKSSAGDLDFDLELDEDTAPEIGMDMNLDASDAMDLDMADSGDEVGTKLDLARAYIDMGDPDGARSILDEVMAEGNPGQKQEAQQLMSQIG